MDRPASSALDHRSGSLRTSREESLPQERWDRPRWEQTKSIRKDQRHWRVAAASGVLSQRLILSFDMTDTLICPPSMSQTHDVTTPVMKTPPPTPSVEPVSRSSQVCMLTASGSVV